MTGLFAAGLLALAVLCVSYWWQRTHIVELAQLRRYLEVLLRRGYKGGFLVVSETGRWGRGERFVQFSKYIASPGVFGIELAFPRSEWSDEYYGRLKQLLDTAGIAYRLERTGRHDTQEFLNVNFGKDLDSAQAVSQTIFEDVFGLPRAATVRMDFTGVSVHDELIDR